jgi:hypothetical protein
MSKLSECIRRALRVDSPPIGFGAAARVSNPSLLLTAFLPSLSPEAAKEAIARGADTCLVAASDAKDREVMEVVEALGEAPAGLYLRRMDGETAAHLAELGIDYAAFDPETALATTLLESKLGHVLSLESDLADVYLRTLEALPLDAILLRHWKGPLTVRQQMELQRISGLARKPLILPVPPQVTAAELQMLREAAVIAVAVEGDNKAAFETLASLRKVIDELPSRRRRREEHGEAILPHIAEAAATASEEGEEEEEEEEEGW